MVSKDDHEVPAGIAAGGHGCDGHQHCGIAGEAAFAASRDGGACAVGQLPVGLAFNIEAVDFTTREETDCRLSAPDPGGEEEVGLLRDPKPADKCPANDHLS